MLASKGPNTTQNSCTYCSPENCLQTLCRQKRKRSCEDFEDSCTPDPKRRRTETSEPVETAGDVELESVGTNLRGGSCLSKFVCFATAEWQMKEAPQLLDTYMMLLGKDLQLLFEDGIVMGGKKIYFTCVGQILVPLIDISFDGGL